MPVIIPPKMVNKFLNFPEEPWWSSNINKVVICNNIPVDIAKKLFDQNIFTFYDAQLNN